MPADRLQEFDTAFREMLATYPFNDSGYEQYSLDDPLTGLRNYDEYKSRSRQLIFALLAENLAYAAAIQNSEPSWAELIARYERHRAFLHTYDECIDRGIQTDYRAPPQELNVLISRVSCVKDGLTCDDLQLLSDVMDGVPGLYLAGNDAFVRTDDREGLLSLPSTAFDLAIAVNRGLDTSEGAAIQLQQARELFVIGAGVCALDVSGMTHLSSIAIIGTRALECVQFASVRQMRNVKISPADSVARRVHQ